MPQDPDAPYFGLFAKLAYGLSGGCFVAFVQWVVDAQVRKDDPYLLAGLLVSVPPLLCSGTVFTFLAGGGAERRAPRMVWHVAVTGFIIFAAIAVLSLSVILFLLHPSFAVGLWIGGILAYFYIRRVDAGFEHPDEDDTPEET